MKNIFNSLTNWKKNINPIDHFGLSIYIISDNSETNDLYNTLYIIMNNLSDLELRNKFKEQYDNESFKELKILEIQKHESIDSIYKAIGINHTYYSEEFKIVNINIICSSINIEVINVILDNLDLHFMVFYNYNNYYWDNNKRVESYKYTKGLKIIYDEFNMIQIVDLSDRYGRFKDKSTFRFIGGSDYWFGETFFKLYDIDQFKIYLDCDRNEIINNKTIHIKLFDLENYWNDENQKRLKKFRQLLLID